MSRESLTAIFERLIRSLGPISLSHYMGEANARYYAARDPLGAAGDFITAPEISQMFGELCGLWLADIWIRAGKPAPVHYVEPGPGRGTLARDALKAMRRFGLEPAVHLIEGSPALRALQGEAVPQAQWHHDFATLPTDGPLLLLANEFLDALPVRQLVRHGNGWRERMVGLRDGGFLPVIGDRPMDAAIPHDRSEAPEAAILEVCPGASAVMAELATRLATQGGAALFIDYGYAEPRFGSTLQAVRAHRKVDPFVDPGTADLTALVDFGILAEVATANGARWLGTVAQGDWLKAMGIEQRAAQLAKAAPAHGGAIAAALQRLTAPDQMGDLFKVMGLVTPAWPAGAGFNSAP